jgi:predicted DCC family thiol-disulfide oxidoreductase YuxK
MNVYHLIYDDNCPVCLKGVDRIKDLDKLGLVYFVPLSKALDIHAGRLPTGGRLREEIHLIAPDKKVYRGAEAVGVLAGLFPRSRIVGNFILLPGVRSVARVVYGFVARHRMKLSRIAALN